MQRRGYWNLWLTKHCRVQPCEGFALRHRRIEAGSARALSHCTVRRNMVTSYPSARARS